MSCSFLLYSKVSDSVIYTCELYIYVVYIFTTREELMQTADSFEKILILGKIEGRRRRG